LSLALVFLPEAQEEFDEAVDWYEEQRVGLGDEFIDSVDDALDLILENPRLYEVVHDPVRRAVVRRFPYSVIYEIQAEQILIVAVFHDRRDPAVWRSRL
jgi:plasmid stabilization system protein ParE